MENKIQNKKTQKIGGLFLNGEFDKSEITQNFDLVVACDGGYKNAIDAGITPNVLVGDMDSLVKTPDGVKIFKYPSEKDFTDGEAGLEYLVENGCDEIFIYFGLGKRLSHTISNLQMASKYAGQANITFFGMQEKVMLKSGTFSLNEKIGSTISIAPISGQVHIISSKGLKYPLESLTLQTNSARGVSNIAVGKIQEVTFQEGVLLVSVWEG
ncbi:MAG: thiamine diphosphokinase [Bacillota bacterium]